MTLVSTREKSLVADNALMPLSPDSDLARVEAISIFAAVRGKA